MRCLFEPRLVNEALGEPGLYVDFRDERRALLFDLGDIRVLPPRKLMRLSHVFVTHAHMDHFAGFDHCARFSSRTNFVRESSTSWTVDDDIVHDEATFRVRARFVDHDIPCLAYAIEEKAHVNVAKDRLAALGVGVGAWLSIFRHATRAPITRCRTRCTRHGAGRSIGRIARCNPHPRQ